MNNKTLFRRLSAGIPGLWLIVFGLAPLLIMLAASFLARSESSFITPAFSLEGYAKTFSPLFLTILLKSAYLAGGTTLLCLLAGYPFAYCVARMPKAWRGPLLMLVIIPFWTNSLIRTYALVFMLKSKGLLSQFLLWAGIIEKPLSLMYTEAAVFIGMTYTLLPFMILPIYSSIEKMDNRLLEAARDLGANRWQAFRRVTLPLSMPGVLAGSMMVFLPALGMFYIPDLLGGGKHLIVGNYIKNQFLTSRDWPAGAAASMALTALMLCLLSVYRWTDRHRNGGKGGNGI
ncbi:spermidine/putrescine ABC transporter permease PotB [Pseudodesulfovibrio tunisiensis]|uniref:spermidine/putrescine ABC transporter permease PotB n=1 Tax=Pseudodesulfovibrio tunisiensis TaxID=463192 RepID=UPI001FB45D6E|nr:spermidine/putrescine ABC transporter permease PotB [Pseudodesulfovibrio tunisiensis]